MKKILVCMLAFLCFLFFTGCTGENPYMSGDRFDIPTEKEEELIPEENPEQPEDKSNILPKIYVATENEQKITSKEDYVSCTVSVNNCDEQYVLEEQEAQIRGRGNSTWHLAKKPYRIKFGSKQNLLGLNNGKKFKNWVLLAEAFDFSMSRNYINFYIGSFLNVYCSDCTFVDLYVNNEYYGMYLLGEQQQINSGRIEVEEYKEGKSDPLDTGYLLENDYNYYMNEEFVIENKINNKAENYTHWIVKSDTTTNEQLDYITEFMQRVYDALYKNADRQTVEGLIDINSAVEMTVLGLINTDPDQNSSFYVFKDKGGKLQFGAPWDADMCYGIVEQTKSTSKVSLNHLLKQLYNRDWFKQMVKERWIELTADGLKDKVIEKIDYIAETYEQEFEKNRTVYDPFGTKPHSYHVDEVLDYKCQKDAAKHLKEWLTERFINIDIELGVNAD